MKFLRLALLMLVISLLGIFTSGTASATTITVNSVSGADYTTIQAAIDAANPGDTIEVQAGTYNGQARINKDVTITSTTGDYATGGVIIDPNGASYVEPTYSQTIASAVTFETGSTGASLVGVTIQNTGTSSNTPNSGIEIVDGSIDNVLIDSVKVDGVNGNGFGSYHPDHTWPPPNGWVIDNSSFSTSTGGTWSGMKPENMCNLTIQNCQVGPTNYGGILMVQADGAIVQNNQVHDTQLAGIQIDAYCTNAINILRNEVWNINLSDTASYSDIRLYSTQENPHANTPATITVENNILRDGFIGIYVKSGDLTTRTAVTITKNSITGHSNSSIANDATTGVLNASANCLGSLDEDVVFSTIVNPNTVDFTPLLSSTDADVGTPGFQPDLTPTASVKAHALGQQVGDPDRINEAVGLAPSS